LTFSAGLYQLTYWSKFDINGLEFISISEILKSSIYPIALTFVFVIMGIILGELIFRFDNELKSGEGRKTKVGEALNSRLGLSILILIWILLLIYLYYNENVYRWIIWAFIFSSVPTVLLDRLGLWQDRFDNNTIRLWAIRLLIYIPVFSFCAGKISSETIYENIRFEYVLGKDLKNFIEKFPVSETDTLKYLGMSDNYLHFITKDNTEKYFVERDELTYIKLLNYKIKE
jgi:hypothetical protein